MAKVQSIGIDLGTTNSAMALSTTGSASGAADALPIVQVVGANRLGEALTFASAPYIPPEGQFTSGSTRLPWTNDDPPYILGNYARDIGAQVPDRLVTSAKSWLNHHSVDPRKPILPWKSALVENKISPMDATRRYLSHLREAFKAECEKRGLSNDISDTQVVLTVPASFDEAGRTITAQAAVEAGWGDEVVLLEEPQAAFYAWLGKAGSTWRDQVKAGDLILICDVGGGTTDLSLIAVSQAEGNLELERISVGRHILLGGDNMDLALAYALRQQLSDEGSAIDDWQFLALVHASKKAKEELFENDDLKEITVAVPSRGAGLMAGTVSTKLTRTMLYAITVDGFFATTAATEMPVQEKSIGLQEFGLAYDPDPVVSKHIAEFLAKSMKNVQANKKLAAMIGKEKLGSAFIPPDAILFNGGVFRARQLRERVIAILQSWMPERTVRELVGTDLDLAVAHGASIYGYNKITNKGIRIRSGVSRSYYIGLEPSVLAIPGYRPPIEALCVAEQGMEEGEERVLQDKEFGLVTGATVAFRFFSASDRAGDTVGTIVQNAAELEETTALEMTLPEVEALGENSAIPVQLHTRLNELGVLQLWMQHTLSEKKWELNFSVRTE